MIEQYGLDDDTREFFEYGSATHMLPSTQLPRDFPELKNYYNTNLAAHDETLHAIVVEAHSLMPVLVNAPEEIVEYLQPLLEPGLTIRTDTLCYVRLNNGWLGVGMTLSDELGQLRNCIYLTSFYTTIYQDPTTHYSSDFLPVH